MSWLNLNQSLNSLKGQITNFASEVLSEAPAEETGAVAVKSDANTKELEDKCRTQELEIAALKKLNEELEATLQSERLSRKNGVREDDTNWYWDPPPQTAKPSDHDTENQYKVQIRTLQDELSTLRERETIDLRPEAEEEIHRLREENKNLTTNLEDLDNQHQAAMDRLLSLKKELQKNFEMLRQEHEDLKTANDEYADETKNLLLKLSERDKEIESLKTSKSDYETLHHKYQNLERIHSLLRENAEKFQEENQDLHEEVFKLQEQVTKLEHDLEISSKNAESTVPREKYEDLIKELNDLRHRRNSKHDHSDEVNIDDNAKSVIESLKREINDLKHLLSLKDSENVELDHKSIKAEKVMQFYNKYINFELPVDYVGEIPSRGDNLVLYKLESVFKTVNSFKKNIDTLEHQLSEKNLNLNHLQTQIDDLTTENDFLTTDIQHYERELDEMKKNNDFLISEIAALKNTSKLEPIIETHEDNLAKLETELADCNRINKTFESEIKRIERELSEVRTEKHILQESLNDLRNKYTTMLTELDMCKSQAKELEELEHTSNTEQAKILKMQLDEIDEFKKRLHVTSTKNEQLSIDIHIIENDKVLLTKEVDELKHALREKSNEQRELENIKMDLDRKLEDVEHKLDDVIKHKNEIEDEKLKLEEKMLILEKDNLSQHANVHGSGDINKLETEKARLLEEFKQAVSEKVVLHDTVENLKSELLHLKQKHEQLLAENITYKNESHASNESSAVLQETLNKLKDKILHEEFLNNQILELKEENKKLSELKVQAEAELSNTDTKILHLEEEFDKLLSDMNEKDSLIDVLNSTVNNNNNALQTLNKNVNDLENTVSNKNKQIEDLKTSLEVSEKKLHDIDEKSKVLCDELNKLHKEKEEMSNQLLTFNDELLSKNEQISILAARLDEFSTLSSLVDTKDKEIKELSQTIAELSDKLKVTENMTLQNDEYSRISNEKVTIEKQVSELSNTIACKDNELIELRSRFEQLEKTCLEYKSISDNTTAEKTELINLINLKHNESIQYHNEIQRLNHVLLEQSNEFKKTLEEQEKLRRNTTTCENCEILRTTLKEKDEIIMNLTHNTSDNENLRSELMNATESIKVLKEKCDNLDKSLAIQLDTVKKLTAENAQLSEHEQNSTRELERLRHHLVEMEENYTQELMTSEQKLTECQTRLHQVEERAKQTSTVYTSNSIRANQEVETLRNQIKLLEKQREEVQAKLGEAEDARSRSEAALTNLQVVLEQFQLDKERDIQTATEKIRNKMEDLKLENQKLMKEIARLNSKLEEALAGLQAASRLGDQVETKTAQINDLKEQVKTLQGSVTAAEERYYNAISNQQDKVDKNLVKNLVINYVVTSTVNSHNKTQVLRILSTVLDFNQQECEKLGLARSANATDSLAAEFVKFLQNESKPRGPLPNMMGIAQASSRSTTPTSRKNSSTIGPHNFEVGHKRNPSTGSNNLLFQNLDALTPSGQLPQLDTGVTQTRDTEAGVEFFNGPNNLLFLALAALAPSGHLPPQSFQPRAPQLHTGVNQTRDTGGAILKHVRGDM